LQLEEPYIRFDVVDDVPPQITGAWVGLPQVTPWQAAFETSIIDAEAAALLPGARALRMGSSLPGPVDHLYLRLNEAIAGSTLAPAVTITDPDGQAVSVLAVDEVRSEHENEAGTWEVLEGYRIRFTPQTKEGEYSVRIAPQITDSAGNKLDGDDADRTGGEPEDAYQGTFRIVPVQVFGAADLSDDVLTTHSTNGFGVVLWEKVGQLDPVPGVPQAGDAPDYVVSLTNDLTGSRFTWLGETYAFTKDLAGQPIQNQDPQEGGAPRELYVTLLGQNRSGAYIDAATITADDHSADPLWVALHPEPLAAGRHQEWARLKICGKSDVTSYPAGEIGGPLEINIRADQLVVYPFRVLSWLSAAANTVAQSLDVTPRRPIYLSTEIAAPYGEDWYEPAHNMIVVPSHLLNDPLSFWHAYAHALQSAAHGYADVPHHAADAGVIWESNSDATAFVEGVASWLAAWLSEQVTPPPYQPAPLSQFRRPEFLAQNDFWMGFDGYGFAQNADAADTKLSPGRLRADGVNNNANTGDNVAGGIASLLWQLGPEFFAPALAAQTAAEFFAVVAEDSSAVSAFLDQGLAVADDRFEPNDIVSAAKTLPIGTTLVDNLILAETDAGQGDWFRLRIPAAGVSKTYALTARVRFTGRQGDLDLVVRTGDGRLVAADTSRGGDSALVHLTGLDASKTYDFLIGVFGHGALLPSGDPSPWGGDYSPYYMLQFSYPGHILPYLPQQTTSTLAFQSWDPNEKVGPAAAGAGRFIHESAALPYTVYFENDPELATVPAQRVVITDQLDSDLDWSSFQFGPIRFGETVILVPDPVGRLHFETDTTVAYDAYPVHVTADLNPETGVLTWELRSVDPQSGSLPRDLLAGFLPPNDDVGRGAGCVSYSVRLKPGLAEGTSVRNQASIVFDFNDPIITNEVVYAVDAQLPSSTVSPLDPTTPWLTFPVAWGGNDSGAGIAAYDVYVSDNGGAFQPWLAATPLTTAAYSGQSGHTYAFYSVAIDGVGHREAAPATADAVTSVVVSVWHNSPFPCDVDGSQRVDAADVLAVINYINSHPGDPSLPAPPASGPPFYDVDDSGDVTPVDALLAINYINSHLGAAGEGEFAPTYPAAEAGASRPAPTPLPLRPATDASPLARARGDASLARWTSSQAAVLPALRFPPRRVPAAQGDSGQLTDELLESILATP